MCSEGSRENREPRLAWVSLYSKFLLERALIPLIEKAQGKVLDIGSGDQPYARFLGTLVEQYIAVDYPPTSVSYTGRPNVWCDAEHLPFRDRQFDTVLCTEVLEHCPHPEMVISEASRVMNTGGLLILSFPLHYWVHDLPYDFHRLTPFGIRFHIEENGLMLERLIFRGSGLSVWVDLTSKLMFLIGADVLTFLTTLPFRVPSLIGLRLSLFDRLVGLINRFVYAVVLWGLRISQKGLIALIIVLERSTAALLPAKILRKFQEKKDYWSQFYTLGLIVLCRKK